MKKSAVQGYHYSAVQGYLYRKRRVAVPGRQDSYLSFIYIVVVLGRSLWVAVSLKGKEDTVDARKENGCGTRNQLNEHNWHS